MAECIRSAGSRAEESEVEGFFMSATPIMMGVLGWSIVTFSFFLGGLFRMWMGVFGAFKLKCFCTV